MSNPSRFDLDPIENPKKDLMTGAAGHWFNQETLQPYCNRYQCDIRTSDTKSEGLLPNTRAILLLGERAFHEWSSGYEKYTLQEQRGCPLDNSYDLPCIASFLPQDAMDIVDFESKHNKELKEQQAEEYDAEDEDEVFEGKRHGKTKRAHYRFWLAKDVKKLLSKLFPVVETDKNKKLGRWLGESTNNTQPQYEIFPSSIEVLRILTTTKGKEIFLDIETDSQLHITCFSFGFTSDRVYVIPLLRYDYTNAYYNIEHILRALAVALRDNTTVVHNSMFDLIVLAWKYKLPIGRKIYDTMLAQHRIFSGMEKSLGHCMSLWTWEKFHKDEGVFEPQNSQQERMLWEYNGKDVYGMMLVKQAQDNYAEGNPGLISSIALGNDCIYPYLLNTLLGIRYDQARLESILKENDRKMMQYLRIIKLLVGPLYDKLGKSNSPMPLSNQKCVKYFHELLGYKFVKKSKKTGIPSLDADSIYKLKLENSDNPVLDLVIAYRTLAKESGSLKFIPWRTNNETLLPESTMQVS
jgi:hypothetical protein